MYFFKRENGKWIIGATVESEIIKVPCKLIRKTGSNISVSKIEDNSLLIDSIEVTDIKKNSAGDFYESYNDFKTGVTEFFDNRFMWDKTAVVNNESLAITNQFIVYGIGTSTITCRWPGKCLHRRQRRSKYKPTMRGRCQRPSRRSPDPSGVDPKRRALRCGQSPDSTPRPMTARAAC